MLTRASSGHHFSCPTPSGHRPSLVVLTMSSSMYESSSLSPSPPILCKKGNLLFSPAVWAKCAECLRTLDSGFRCIGQRPKSRGEVGVSLLTFKMPHNGLSVAALIYTHRLHVTPPTSLRAHLSSPKVSSIFFLPIHLQFQWFLWPMCECATSLNCTHKKLLHWQI